MKRQPIPSGARGLMALRSSRDSFNDPAGCALDVVPKSPVRATQSVGIRKVSALSAVDDTTYFDVITKDVLHVQQRLTDLARTAEASGRSLPASYTLSYSENELCALRQLPLPQAKLTLHELLADKLMLLERASLQATAEESAHSAPHAKPPSDHCAPSLSRLPFLLALLERLQQLHEARAQQQQPAPRPATPSHALQTARRQLESSRAALALQQREASAALSAVCEEVSALEQARLPLEASLAHVRASEASLRSVCEEQRGQLHECEARAAAVRAELSLCQRAVEAKRAQVQQAREEADEHARRRELAEAEAQSEAARAEVEAGAAAELQQQLESLRAQAARAAASDSAEARLRETEHELRAALEELGASREAAAQAAASAASHHEELAAQVARVQHDSAREVAAAREQAQALESKRHAALAQAARGDERLGELEEELRSTRERAERAERANDALVREAELLAAGEEEETFERVLAQEMTAMRAAYEAKLAEAQAERSELQAKHRAELKAVRGELGTARNR